MALTTFMKARLANVVSQWLGINLGTAPTGDGPYAEAVTLVDASGASFGVPSNAMALIDGYLPAVQQTWTSGTSLNTAATFATAGMDTLVLTVAPPAGLTAGVVSFEAFDGYNWVAIKSPRTDSYATDAAFGLSGSPGTHSWQIPVAGYPQARARLSTAIVGSGNTTITGVVSSTPDTSIVTVGIDPAATSPPVGAAGGLATAQVAMTASAALIVAARNGAVATGRVSATIYNMGANTVFVGASGVTAATGMPVLPGGSMTLYTTGAIYGICAASLTSTAAVLEVY